MPMLPSFMMPREMSSKLPAETAGAWVMAAFISATGLSSSWNDHSDTGEGQYFFSFSGTSLTTAEK